MPAVYGAGTGGRQRPSTTASISVTVRSHTAHRKRALRSEPLGLAGLAGAAGRCAAGAMRFPVLSAAEGVRVVAVGMVAPFESSAHFRQPRWRGLKHLAQGPAG